MICSKIQKRWIHVALTGAASPIGQPLAFLLKTNNYVEQLSLHDFSINVKDIAAELQQIPGGPVVKSFFGAKHILAALKTSNIIVITEHSLVTAKPVESLKYLREKIYKICDVIPQACPEALIVLATNHLNVTLPMADKILWQRKNYVPIKLFGSTNINTIRANVLVANVLNLKPADVYVPVLGGNTDETIVPLFSQMIPSVHCMDENVTKKLTEIIRGADVEIMKLKHGIGSANLSLAWAINDFIKHLIRALENEEIVQIAYTRNDTYGTRFFSGPVKIGKLGLVEAIRLNNLTNYENSLLENCIEYIKEDVKTGEQLVNNIKGQIQK